MPLKLDIGFGVLKPAPAFFGNAFQQILEKSKLFPPKAENAKPCGG